MCRFRHEGRDRGPDSRDTPVVEIVVAEDEVHRQGERLVERAEVSFHTLRLPDVPGYQQPVGRGIDDALTEHDDLVHRREFEVDVGSPGESRHPVRISPGSTGHHHEDAGRVWPLCLRPHETSARRLP